MNKLSFTALLLGMAVTATAGTITSYTTGGQGYNGVVYAQSVTTPTGGPWDNIGFNFLNGDGGAYARGGLYVFTQAYSGTPAAMSSASTGYLGFSNTISDGIWNFSSVTLNPGTQYFFYMDGIVPLGEVIKLVPADVYGGGAISTNSPTGSFVSYPGDALFVLSGTQVSATPEPGTLALMAGAAALLGLRRRRKA